MERVSGKADPVHSSTRSSTSSCFADDLHDPPRLIAVGLNEADRCKRGYQAVTSAGMRIIVNVPSLIQCTAMPWIGLSGQWRGTIAA